MRDEPALPDETVRTSQSSPIDGVRCPEPTRPRAPFPFDLSPTTAADDPLGWRDLGLCAQTDPEAFFPEKGGTTKPAKALCKSCEVQVDCLDYALANDERFGVWGGASERERRVLRRDRSTA